MSIKTFDFYSFLKKASNPSLAPLEDNPRYDTILQAVGDVFDKLYQRAQVVKVTNILDTTSDIEYQKYLNNNDGTIHKDYMLELVSKYFNTDHFMTTMGRLVRLYEERQNGPIADLPSFIEEHIIQSFKFFTQNSGDVHKSKGTQVLLERLMDFYGTDKDPKDTFDGVTIVDESDKYGKRFTKFTSYRIGLDRNILKSNYSNLAVLNTLKIEEYMELEFHKLALAEGYLFISRKDRDDWWFIDVVDSIHKINNYYFATRKDDTLDVYMDEANLYNSNYQIETQPFQTISAVEFVPRVANTSNPNDQYQTNNLYYVEKLSTPDTLTLYQYNLKRLHYNTTKGTLSNEYVKRSLGIGYDPLFYTNRTTYPKILGFNNIPWIYLNFENASINDYEFSEEHVDLVYLFEYTVQVQIPDGSGGFTYPEFKQVAIARDGYDFDNMIVDFSYTIIDRVDANTRYMLYERNANDLINKDFSKEFTNDLTQLKALVDFVILKNNTYHFEDFYKYVGHWNPNDNIRPAAAPNNGEFWIVKEDGEYLLNGIQSWKQGDIVTWNGYLLEWVKHNDIANLSDETVSIRKIDRIVYGISSDYFVDDNEKRGIFPFKLSEIQLPISNLNKIISVDVNAYETFGNDAAFMVAYTSTKSSRIEVVSLDTRTFDITYNTIDLTRMLRSYPFNNSALTFHKLEITDKHMIAYCLDTAQNNYYAVILENATHNFPFGLRGNHFKVSYDAEYRTEMTNKQPNLRIEDEDGNVVEGEEVETFKSLLDIYTPINTVHNSLGSHRDFGMAAQGIQDDSLPDNFTFTSDWNGSTKTLIDQKAARFLDTLILTTFGDPDDINCDCDRQRDILYVTDINAMTYNYDLENETIDPRIIGVPTKIKLTKVGDVNDEYSGYENVCRFESDWFNYYYDIGETIPMLFRTKIRANLFQKVQRFVPWGSSTYLTYAWSLFFLTQQYDTPEADTVPFWNTVISTSIYKPIVLNDECNPIGIFYTTKYIEDGNTIPMILDTSSSIPIYVPMTPKDPWDIYDIVAAKISLV